MADYCDNPVHDLLPALLHAANGALAAYNRVGTMRDHEEAFAMARLMMVVESVEDVYLAPNVQPAASPAQSGADGVPAYEPVAGAYSSPLPGPATTGQGEPPGDTDSTSGEGPAQSGAATIGVAALPAPIDFGACPKCRWVALQVGWFDGGMYDGVTQPVPEGFSLECHRCRYWWMVDLSGVPFEVNRG